MKTDVDVTDEVTCVSCGSTMDSEDALTTGNEEYVCGDCVMTCNNCDFVGEPNDCWYEVDGDMWCEGCTNDHASFCDGCEQYHTGSAYRMADARGESFCESCIEDAYYCDGCDLYYRNGCDRGCGEDQDDENIIHDYNYRPDPIFHSTKDSERLYFGMEIEVEAPNGEFSVKTQAAEYAQRLEGQELAYLKSDGSLNCGFEVVTHPMSHDFFKNEQPEFWNTLEHLRTNLRMRSWSTQTCGLHIHISRTGFNSGSHMHKFLELVYGNAEQYSKLAGREASRWAKFDDVLKEHEMTYDDAGGHWRRNAKPAFRTYKAKIEDGRNTDRYSAVNTQNANTLEMRIFKGSLKMETVKSALDLAHASVEYTRGLTVKQVRDGGLKWDAFHAYILAHADIYAELVARLDLVGLDVSELSTN